MLPIHFGRETVPSGASAGTERNDSGPDQATMAKHYQPGSGMVTPDKSYAQAMQTVPGTNGTAGLIPTSPAENCDHCDQRPQQHGR